MTLVTLYWAAAAMAVVWCALALQTLVNLLAFKNLERASRRPASRVSIVIPARDEVRYVGRTLDAALRQDYDDFEDEDGCPEPDNDRDGILDEDDQCPNQPEDKDGVEDEDGCPEGNKLDRDGDGILDEDDECPDDPEDKDEFEDEDGIQRKVRG